LFGTGYLIRRDLTFTLVYSLSPLLYPGFVCRVRLGPRHRSRGRRRRLRRVSLAVRRSRGVDGENRNSEASGCGPSSKRAHPPATRRRGEFWHGTRRDDDRVVLLLRGSRGFFLNSISDREGGNDFFLKRHISMLRTLGTASRFLSLWPANAAAGDAVSCTASSLLSDPLKTSRAQAGHPKKGHDC